MEILQLKYFCDAAETENFSVTAKRYNVPVSNISQTIKRLEKELGVELFEHCSNKILLNDRGKIFYKKVKSALGMLEEAKLAAGENSERVEGEIKLLIHTNRRFLTEKIGEFKSLYPNVSFKLKHGRENSQDFDLIVADDIFDDVKYEKKLLISEKILIAVEKSHTLADKKEISVSDLKNERFITMPDGTSLYSITHKICGLAGFVPNITIQSDDPYYIRKYVEIGLGIAFVPSVSWQGQFSENVVLKEVGEIERNTYIFKNKGRYMPKCVNLFYEMLTKNYKK